MSHKDKLCQPALASHIEVCHEQCNFTPLVISEDLTGNYPHKSGLPAIIEHELGEVLDERIGDVNSATQGELRKIKKSLGSVLDKAECKSVHTNSLKATIFSAFEKEAESQKEAAINDVKYEIISNSEGRLDLTSPDKAIQLRAAPVREELVKLASGKRESIKFERYRTYEMEGLGMFFKESVCHRSEGLTYSSCGKEMTILPGEVITENNVLTTTSVSEDSTVRTTSENLTTKDSTDISETLNTSYDRTVRKETDIKLAHTSSFKLGMPFKVLKLDLQGSSNASIGFNKVITEVNKQSSSKTQKRFNEVVRNLSINNTVNSSRTLTSTSQVAFNRTWKNETDKPQTYIRRKSYCKTSVLHKRHNAQLAWTGCIDNPAKDLCTPDNIEEKHAAEIQAIKDKWNSKAAPAEFGPRPQGVSKCTDPYQGSMSKPRVIKFQEYFYYSIPSGWSYEGGSAVVTIVSTSTDPIETLLYQEPNHGDRGSVKFEASLVVENKFLHTERVEFKVCFNIIPDAAVAWDAKVQQWRDEEAQGEIDAFLAKELEKLNKFLASDQAKATIERRIFEDLFGVTDIEDCCRLIAKIKSLFDFDAMCYSLLPSWNDGGEGCQRAFPVTMYTAKCLHFYLPMVEGAEIEALSHLVAINAIPWNSQIATQVTQYIQTIQNMRDTLYNRLFNPAGWDVKFDQPNGYEMTPFDTTSQNWSADHESDLNYELIGAFTINVPCGERVDCRPALCC